MRLTDQQIKALKEYAAGGSPRSCGLGRSDRGLWTRGLVAVKGGKIVVTEKGRDLLKAGNRKG